ncbi:hypothetical protein CBL_20545 [Carabus blaptoides fortunei]
MDHHLVKFIDDGILYVCENKRLVKGIGNTNRMVRYKHYGKQAMIEKMKLLQNNITEPICENIPGHSEKQLCIKESIAQYNEDNNRINTKPISSNVEDMYLLRQNKYIAKKVLKTQFSMKQSMQECKDNCIIDDLSPVNIENELQENEIAGLYFIPQQEELSQDVEFPNVSVENIQVGTEIITSENPDFFLENSTVEKDVITLSQNIPLCIGIININTETGLIELNIQNILDAGLYRDHVFLNENNSLQGIITETQSLDTSIRTCSYIQESTIPLLFTLDLSNLIYNINFNNCQSAGVYVGTGYRMNDKTLVARKFEIFTKMRRNPSKSYIGDFLPCPNCKGHILPRNLARHERKCTGREANRTRPVSVAAALAKPIVFTSVEQKLVHRLLKVLTNDVVSDIVKSDKLLHSRSFVSLQDLF